MFVPMTHQLNAERIGHGLHLFDEKKIADPDSLNMPPRRYVAGLAQYLAEHRITLEVCLSSNAQTVPELRNNLAAYVAGLLTLVLVGCLGGW